MPTENQAHETANQFKLKKMGLRQAAEIQGFRAAKITRLVARVREFSGGRAKNQKSMCQEGNRPIKFVG